MKNTVKYKNQYNQPVQEERYLAGLNQKIDEHERIMIKNELGTGVFVNAASVIMRLGVATTILTGAELILSGRGASFKLHKI